MSAKQRAALGRLIDDMTQQLDIAAEHAATAISEALRGEVKPLIPSFHNACTITARSAFAHWCEDHGVRVYRDGADWCTLPEPGK